MPWVDRGIGSRDPLVPFRSPRWVSIFSFLWESTWDVPRQGTTPLIVRGLGHRRWRGTFKRQRTTATGYDRNKGTSKIPMRNHCDVRVGRTLTRRWSMQVRYHACDPSSRGCILQNYTFGIVVLKIIVL